MPLLFGYIGIADAVASADDETVATRIDGDDGGVVFHPFDIALGFFAWKLSLD